MRGRFSGVTIVGEVRIFPLRRHQPSTTRADRDADGDVTNTRGVVRLQEDTMSFP